VAVYFISHMMTVSWSKQWRNLKCKWVISLLSNFLISKPMILMSLTLVGSQIHLVQESCLSCL
jgi:hypothetical protein